MTVKETKNDRLKQNTRKYETNSEIKYDRREMVVKSEN